MNPPADQPSQSYESFVYPITNDERGGFDVHVYFQQNIESEVKFATELWERIRRECTLTGFILKDSRLILRQQFLSCAYTEYGISPLAHILLPCSKSTCSRLLNSAPSSHGWSSTADHCQHCYIQTLAMIFVITRNVLPGLGSLFHSRSVCSDDSWRRELKQPRTTSTSTEVYRVSKFEPKGRPEASVLFHVLCFVQQCVRLPSSCISRTHGLDRSRQ